MSKDAYKAMLESALIDKHAIKETGDKVQKNRKDKRRTGQSAMGRAKRRVQIKGSTSRLLALGSGATSNKKTGTSDWFANLKAQGEIRRHLRKQSIRKLEPLIGSSAEILYAAGIKNLWALCEADINDLLAIEGIKTGDLRKIRRAFSEQGVQIKWSIV